MTKKFTCNAIAVSLWRCSVPLLAAFAVAGAHAVNIDYGNIKSTEEGFRKHWQLSEAEARRYHNYMEVAGKYRHKDANPLDGTVDDRGQQRRQGLLRQEGG